MFTNLARYIDPNQVTLTYLLATTPNSCQCFEDEVTKYNVRVIYLGEVYAYKIPQWSCTLYRALREYGPFDAVHANMEFLNGCAMLVSRLASIPLRICHAHRAASVLGDNSFFIRAYRNLMRFFMKKDSQVLLACSEQAGKYFFGEKSFFTLYNGIDLSRFIPSESYSKKQTKGYHFITVSRIAQVKNPFF